MINLMAFLFLTNRNIKRTVMSLEILLIAFSLALIIEGLFPALFPNRWQAYVRKLSQESPESIRSVGIIVILLGSLLLWFTI